MKKVLFYPDSPIQHPGHTLSKTIRYFIVAGYELTNDINDNWDLAVHWDHRDINKTPEKLLNDNRLVLNKNVNNVTKSNVEKIFQKVFGYSSLADTSKFGYCVKKTNKQSVHDGVITRMPCKQEKGYIYQLLLDNRWSIDMIYDIRIPVFLGNIPMLVLKGRGVIGTFENTLSNNKKYVVVQTEQYIDKSEIDKITKFCKLIGLDVGEIDAIRDNSTGKLYLIDVNNIPGAGFYRHIKNGEETERKLSEYFISLL